jgi:hypothetical protein
MALEKYLGHCAPAIAPSTVVIAIMHLAQSK